MTFFRGLAFGFALAVPVGPIGLLVIRRTLAQGRAVGLATGLGAATADTAYGALAGAGVTAVADVVTRYEAAFAVASAVLLVALGVRIATSAPAREVAAGDGRTLLRAWGSTVALTAANPATVLTFVALFTGLGVVGSAAAAAWLVVGVGVGSAVWWLVLTTGVALAGRRLGARGFGWLNRLSGAGIALLGLAAGVRGLV